MGGHKSLRTWPTRALNKVRDPALLKIGLGWALAHWESGFELFEDLSLMMTTCLLF